MSPRQIIWRGLGLGILATLVCAGLFLGFVQWYTGTDRIVPGVTVGQAHVGGMTVRQARQALRGASGGAQRRLPVLGALGGAPIRNQQMPQGAPDPEPIILLRWADQVRPLSLREIGAVPDTRAALAEARGLGRDGTLMHRANVFLTGLIHGYYVPEQPNLQEQVLSQRLAEIAREVERPARDAAYDFETDKVTEGASGQALDVPASMQAIRQALRQGRRDVDLVLREVAPAVTSEDLAGSHRYLIAHFTTPILAADPGRLQNIAMAVRKISGVALKPGQVFSFNGLVGPRDAEHGWAQANEIYQGEYVLGYGGGICQVSSTLYNAVLLAGLEVKERYHHDRPLQYIDPGRDATVAWNVLDFKFRNSTDMPVLIGARVVAGAPQEIEVSLYAPRRATEASVSIEAADVRYYPPELEEVLDTTLPADSRNVVDEGHYGIELKIFRVFKEGGKERRELVSHDKYLPKPGKVKVGVGNAPGSDRLLNPGVH
jgi:vancomycin resistance protein YoaR